MTNANLYSATDEDLRKFYGSGNLLIGSLVRPPARERPTTEPETEAVPAESPEVEKE